MEREGNYEQEKGGQDAYRRRSPIRPVLLAYARAQYSYVSVTYDPQGALCKPQLPA